MFAQSEVLEMVLTVPVFFTSEESWKYYDVLANMSSQNWEQLQWLLCFVWVPPSFLYKSSVSSVPAGGV